MRTAPAVLVLAMMAGLACSDDRPAEAPPEGAEAPRALGPADGHDLPGVALERVALGDPAPDFTLESYDDGVVTLSDFRGEKDVILVFYRGHW